MGTSDQEFITSLLQGEEQGWNALVSRYQQLIYSVARALCHQDEDCAEIFRLVCLDLYQGVKQLRGNHPEPAWVITVTKRRAGAMVRSTNGVETYEDQFKNELELIEREFLAANGYEKIRSASNSPHLVNAPRYLIEMAEAIPYACDRPANIRELAASLVFDSFTQPSVPGARGLAGARHFLFNAGEFDIHIRVWGVGPARRMAGQIVSRTDRKYVLRGTKLHLLRARDRFETIEADWFGEFEFSRVPEGLLDFRIELPLITVTGALNIG